MGPDCVCMVPKFRATVAHCKFIQRFHYLRSNFCDEHSVIFRPHFSIFVPNFWGLRVSVSVSHGQTVSLVEKRRKAPLNSKNLSTNSVKPQRVSVIKRQIKIPPVGEVVCCHATRLTVGDSAYRPRCVREWG
jgi:hypothetical protein